MILVSFIQFFIYFLTKLPHKLRHCCLIYSIFPACKASTIAVYLILFKAMQSMVETIDPAAFEARFSATAEDLGNLIDTKTVTLQRLLEIAPQGNMSISIFVKGIICKFNYRLLPKNEANISIRLTLKNLLFSP